MPAVLHLLNAYLPATETFIWQYLRQAKKFQPVILADRWEHLERFPLPKGDAAFLRLKPQRPPWSRAWAALKGGYAPVAYAGWDQAIRSQGVALAHAHQGFRAIVTQKLLRRSGLPFAASFYGSDISRIDVLKRGQTGYREVFRHAGLLCAEGPRLQKRLIELGAPQEKVKLVRIAIDMGDYPFQERAWPTDGVLRFLFTGRLVEKKGLEFALKSLAGLAKQVAAPNFQLTVVGDGPLLASCHELAQQLGMADKVQWKGLVPLEALRKLLISHHALLAPSCTASDGDAEGGAPTVILEAQATGLPVIASTHDDIPFITVPDQSAYLVPERDVTALTQALARFAAHPQAWPAMGRAGREHVAANHDARHAIDVLEEHYRVLLGRV